MSAMDSKTRRETYIRQTGRKELTGKQAKRLAKKENKRSSAGKAR